MFKLKGKVVKIFNPEVIETKGGNLYKQIVIIDKEGEYTNEIQFQFSITNEISFTIISLSRP